MLKKNIFFLISFLLSINGILAYENDFSLTTTIIGKIVDRDTQTPLEFSTITLSLKKDSSVLTGGISDTDGVFSIETNHRSFFIKIEFIGYSPKTIDKIKLESGQNLVDLGTIELEPNVGLIGEIEVRAEKSSVMMKLDKRVFNVGKDLVSAGGSAEDILRNVPSVSVGIDGSINLRSNGDVLILLNGRPSSLLGGDNSTGLQQIQANQIDYIEIITNPSSRYEAEGTAGIINIVLKNNNNEGLNGSLNANIGNPENFGLGVNMNSHKNKLNWFTGIGAWYVNRPGIGSFRNQFYNVEDTDSTIFSNMDRTHERQSLLRYIRLGVDYQFNPKNSLTTSFSYRRSNDNNPSELVYSDAFGTSENVFLITQRNEKETEEEADLNYFFTYKKLFSRKGHQLTSEFQYENNTQKEISLYEETFFDKENNPIDTADFNQLSNKEEGNRQFLINSDYILPFKKEGKLEVSSLPKLPYKLVTL